jgi:hypothetical protein
VQRKPVTLITISIFVAIALLIAALGNAFRHNAHLSPEAVPKWMPAAIAKRLTPPPTEPAEVADEPPTHHVSTSVTLTIDSDPSGGDVRIEGRMVGITPMALENLYPDRRVAVQIIRRGYRPWSGTFPGGQSTLLRARLQKR